jgi:hypothetical protein
MIVKYTKAQTRIQFQFLNAGSFYNVAMKLVILWRLLTFHITVFCFAAEYT